ncbi:MAG: ubiquitin-conjugating enzyme E2 [Pirellulaceae bacterium]
MDFTTRESRLRAEFEVLKRLPQASSIFSFEAQGDPPDRYVLTFRGRGIARVGTGRNVVEMVDLHQIELRLPFDYPAVPPDLRWITPILHPNVSFSGFIQVRDLGLPWDDSVTLDIVCERLWDVARLAFIQPDRATNAAARNWLAEQSSVCLPVDARTLRDLALPAVKNVIRYQRRGAPPRPTPAPSSEEVLFIGDDTPLPPLPGSRPPYATPGSPGKDEILYIGDD